MPTVENNQLPTRVTEAQLQAAFAKLDERDHSTRMRNRRNQNRLRFKRTNIRVKIVHNASAVLDTVMACWDLSATGICLLHTAFLHRGTELRVTLQRRLGGEESVTGTVAWCLHVQGKLHVIGVRFRETVFVKHFLDPEECKELMSASTPVPSELKGNILFVDDQEMDRVLFGFYLKSTSCELTLAKNTEEAIESMKSKSPSLIACDLNLGGAKGEETIATLRKEGFRGRIVAITAETNPSRLKAAHAAGVDEILNKPYDGTTLIRHLASWLGGRAEDEVISSSLPETPGIEMLLQQYVDQVTGLVEELEKYMSDDDFTGARGICQNLAGTGTGYGYALLSQAAQDALVALDSSQSVSESQTEIRLLIGVSRRLRPVPTNSPPATAPKTTTERLVR